MSKPHVEVHVNKKQMFAKLGFHILKEQVIWLLFSLNPKPCQLQVIRTYSQCVFDTETLQSVKKPADVFSTTPFFSSEFAWEIRHSWGTPGIWIGYHPLDFRFHLLRRLCREMPKEQAIWWGFWWGLNTLKWGLRRLHLKDPSMKKHTTLPNQSIHGSTKLLWFFFLGGGKAVDILLNPRLSGLFGFFCYLWWSYLVKLLQMMGIS